MLKKQGFLKVCQQTKQTNLEVLICSKLTTPMQAIENDMRPSEGRNNLRIEIIQTSEKILKRILVKANLFQIWTSKPYWCKLADILLVCY